MYTHTTVFKEEEKEERRYIEWRRVIYICHSRASTSLRIFFFSFLSTLACYWSAARAETRRKDGR
jgi:hypothetical protein